MDSGLAAARRPGMTGELINHRLSDGRAETGFEEIEIAAFIGLLDVAGEHPAIAALEAAFGRLPCRAAAGEFVLRHIEADAARRDVERDAIAAAHQRERPADIGFWRDMEDARAVARAA